MPVSCRLGSELSWGRHKEGDKTEHCHPGRELPTLVLPGTKTRIGPQTRGSLTRCLGAQSGGTGDREKVKRGTGRERGRDWGLGQSASWN